jgi:16S rRNA (cytidine1402-2'-O)-methyltransferase
VSRLVVVGTPIGNLEDMSPRAVRALREAGSIFCEDTRRTRKLLSALGVPAPRLVRLDRHTEQALVGAAVELIRSGRSVALVSDAGMPTISDPGSVLVKGVADAGLPAEVVPGPSAVTAALALSGLPAGQYRFAGFLPRKGRDRAEALAAVAADPATVVIYEAPLRVAATVSDLLGSGSGDRPVALARELTKLHEEVWRGPLGEAPAWLADRGELRGEWVIVLGPRPVAPAATVGDEEISALLMAKLAEGADRRQAVAEVTAELGLARRRVYEAAVALRARD